MPIQEPEAGPVWDDRAALDPLAAVLDPTGSSSKNQLIDRVQRRALRRVLPELRGKRVLDFGCGTGRLTTFLRGRGADVVGIEAAPAMASVARSAVGPRISIFDGERIPIRSRSVDLVLSVGVLQYFRGALMDRALESISDVLEPRGRVVLVEQVNAGSLGRGAPPERYRDALRRAGFTLVFERVVRRDRSVGLIAVSRMPRLGRLPSLDALVSLEARILGAGNLAGTRYADVLFVGERAS